MSVSDVSPIARLRIVASLALAGIVVAELFAELARQAAHAARLQLERVRDRYRLTDDERTCIANADRDRRIAERVQRRELARLLAELQSTPRLSIDPVPLYGEDGLVGVRRHLELVQPQREIVGLRDDELEVFRHAAAHAADVGRRVNMRVVVSPLAGGPQA